jgi:hypothetical protein
VFWTVIKKELSTNNVLFLGYDLEDPNTSVIFDKISDALQQHRKEWFLVSPNLKQHKINYLITKGIQYINSTAELLIDELVTHLKENIINDLEKGNTSAETFRNFLLNNKLSATINVGPGPYKLQSIKGLDGAVQGKMDLTLKNEKKFIREFKDFCSGKKFGEFEVPEDKLININISYGGLKFPNTNGKSKLVLKRLPYKYTKIDVRFDDGFEYPDIPVKIYGSQKLIEIHLDLNSAQLKIKLEPKIHPEVKYNLEYEHNKICKKTKDEIELFTFLNNLGSGKRFTIYIQSGEVISKIFPEMPPLLIESQFFLDYFKKLKIIEQFYNIRFLNIGLRSISEKSKYLVSKTVSVINGESMSSQLDEFPFELLDNSHLNVEDLKKFNEINTTAVGINNEEEKIEIHGHIINLGFQKIEIFEAYVSNLDSIVDKKESILRIKSRVNKIAITYLKTKDFDIAHF